MGKEKARPNKEIIASANGIAQFMVYALGSLWKNAAKFRAVCVVQVRRWASYMPDSYAEHASTINYPAECVQVV